MLLPISESQGNKWAMLVTHSIYIHNLCKNVRLEITQRHNLLQCSQLLLFHEDVELTKICSQAHLRMPNYIWNLKTISD